MYKILKLNKINEKAENILSKGYLLSDNENNPDGIIVRSAKMHDYQVGDNLLAVARAGAGVNNIPVEKFTDIGIVVFNTPGANANAVKELVMCSLLLAARDIVGGIKWTNSLKGLDKEVPALVEKGKANYGGSEILGKTLGIIGLGAIGAIVAQAAVGLKMKVIGYDPYIKTDTSLLSGDIKKAEDINYIYCNSDYITLHSPLNEDTKGMINTSTISKMKDGVSIINCARNELVNNKDIIEALNSGKVNRYITDFPSDDLIGVKNVITIPHLGASTEEAEINCAIMAANELREYLENGNIINSVNYPALTLERTGEYRITLILSSHSSALTDASELIKANNHQITGMISSSKGEAAYLIIDITGKPDETLLKNIKSIPGILRARLIK